MSSFTRGGLDIAPGKHPTAIRLWEEQGEVVCSRCGNSLDWSEGSPQEMYGNQLPAIMANPAVWHVCKPCLDVMPDVPKEWFGTAVDANGNEFDVQIGGE